jgi:hypothetical protein
MMTPSRRPEPGGVTEMRNSYRTQQRELLPMEPAHENIIDGGCFFLA